MAFILFPFPCVMQYLRAIILSCSRRVICHIFSLSLRFSKWLFQKALGKQVKDKVQRSCFCYAFESYFNFLKFCSVILLISIPQANYSSCKIDLLFILNKLSFSMIYLLYVL